jgi:hypothetical protein
MVSAVGHNQSVLAPSQSQQQTQSKSTDAAFQQSVDQYLQNSSSGVDASSAGANPSQALSSDMMSSLLQMQQ